MIRTALAASILAAFALNGPAPAETQPTAAGLGEIAARPQPIVLGQPFQLKFGETAQLSDDPLSITFKDVVEDSRCPAKVQCVWAGRVVVALSAAVPDGPATSFQLQLGASAGVLAYDVTLNAVAPAKTTDGPPSQDSYVLTLTVNAAR